MQRGAIWNLIAGIFLLIIVLFRYGGAILAGHAPSMEPKNLALDAALLVFALSRFLRFFQPGLAMIGPMRFVGLALVLVYFGLKAKP